MVAHNKIDLSAGGLGGVDGPGLLSLPLLEVYLPTYNRVDGFACASLHQIQSNVLLRDSLRCVVSRVWLQRLDLSHNSLRNLKGLATAPLENIRVLQLRGNGLSRIEGLLNCSHLEVLDLSDNRIRRIDPDGFQGVTETLRCLVMERNGLRYSFSTPASVYQ